MQVQLSTGSQDVGQSDTVQVKAFGSQGVE